MQRVQRRWRHVGFRKLERRKKAVPEGTWCGRKDQKDSCQTQEQVQHPWSLSVIPVVTVKCAHGLSREVLYSASLGLSVLYSPLSSICHPLSIQALLLPGLPHSASVICGRPTHRLSLRPSMTMRVIRTLARVFPHEPFPCPCFVF